MDKLLVLLYIAAALALSASSAAASSEEVFHSSNSLGSSGWELDYGEDEELDREEKAKKKKQLKQDSEHRKPKKTEDFFNTTIDVYEKDLGSLDGRE